MIKSLEATGGNKNEVCKEEVYYTHRSGWGGVVRGWEVGHHWPHRVTEGDTRVVRRQKGQEQAEGFGQSLEFQRESEGRAE